MKMKALCTLMAVLALTLIPSSANSTVASEACSAVNMSVADLLGIDSSTTGWGCSPELVCPLLSWYPAGVCIDTPALCFPNKLVCEGIYGTGNCRNLAYPPKPF